MVDIKFEMYTFSRVIAIVLLSSYLAVATDQNSSAGGDLISTDIKASTTPPSVPITPGASSNSFTTNLTTNSNEIDPDGARLNKSNNSSTSTNASKSNTTGKILHDQQQGSPKSNDTRSTETKPPNTGLIGQVVGTNSADTGLTPPKTTSKSPDTSLTAPAASLSTSDEPSLGVTASVSATISPSNISSALSSSSPAPSKNSLVSAAGIPNKVNSSFSNTTGEKVLLSVNISMPGKENTSVDISLNNTTSVAKVTEMKSTTTSAVVGTGESAKPITSPPVKDTPNNESISQKTGEPGTDKTDEDGVHKEDDNNADLNNSYDDDTREYDQGNDNPGEFGDGGEDENSPISDEPSKDKKNKKSDNKPVSGYSYPSTQQFIIYFLSIVFLVAIIYIGYHTRAKTKPTLNYIRNSISRLCKRNDRDNVKYKKLTTTADESLPTSNGNDLAKTYIY